MGLPEVLWKFQPLLDGMSGVHSKIYTEETNCSHRRWLHLFCETFSWRRDEDKQGIYASQLLPAFAGWDAALVAL